MTLFSHKKPKNFICHVTEDKKSLVDPLVELLQSKKGTHLWYDKISIPKGKPISDEIQKGLKEAKGGVVIFSQNFIKPRKPEEREWAKEEFYVLVHKNKTENCFLIPVFYDIEPNSLPESFKGPLNNINGFPFKKGGNKIELANQIYKVVENKQIEDNKIRKEKRRKSLKYFSPFTAVVIIALYLLISHNYSREPQITKPPVVIADTGKGNNNKGKANPPSEILVNNSNKNKQVFVEDISSYLNTSMVNSNNNIDVSVTIINDNYNIDNSLSCDIADIYNKTGKKGTIGLLRSNFIKKPQFRDLFEGNSDIIEKLKLNNYTDYLALGKISYSFSKGNLVNGTIVCNASIEMNIISTSTKSIIKSFSISDANGNGDNESQAKEYALQNLLSKYYNHHSTL